LSMNLISLLIFDYRGIADDRGKESSCAFFAVDNRKIQTAPRKLAVGDCISLIVDLAVGTLDIEVTGLSGDHFECKFTADGNAKGPVGKPKDFWFGATFANDHKLVIKTTVSPNVIVPMTKSSTNASSKGIIIIIIIIIII
jgi:hypothetical protein